MPKNSAVQPARPKTPKGRVSVTKREIRNSVPEPKSRIKPPSKPPRKTEK